MKTFCVLEHWKWLSSPVKGEQHVHGHIYRHPKFPDGTSITSSFLIGRYRNIVATASGTYYFLGSLHESLQDPSMPEAMQMDQCLKESGINEARDFEQLQAMVERTTQMNGHETVSVARAPARLTLAPKRSL